MTRFAVSENIDYMTMNQESEHSNDGSSASDNDDTKDSSNASGSNSDSSSSESDSDSDSSSSDSGSSDNSKCLDKSIEKGDDGQKELATENGENNAAEDNGGGEDDADSKADSNNSSSNEESEESNDENANGEEEEDSPSEKSSTDDDSKYERKRSTRIRNIVNQKKINKNKRKNWRSETSESESDSDEHSVHNKRAPVNRKLRVSKPNKYSSDDVDTEEERGRSAIRRTTAAAVSYKEASEDEKTDSDDLVEVDYAEESPVAVDEEPSETIERIVCKRLGRKGKTGIETKQFEIEQNGNDVSTESNELLDVNNEDVEVQYFIKWKEHAYIHNTWESEDSLREKKVKGIKKLENFIKREKDIELWRSYAGPEDIDYYECQLELHNELLKSYNNVDRIIAKTVKDDDSVEFLCKWESLPYSEATWETESLVKKKWLKKVNEFCERESSKNSPSRHSKVLKNRPKFQQVKVQPEYLAEGLILRDYQMDGLNWLILTWCKDNSVILADEMGLGKTIQTICFLYYLFQSQNLYGPYLCVVPLSTMTAWQREFSLWAPEMNIVTYLGDVQSRELIRQYEWCFEGSKRLKFNTILTTYEILLKDKAFLGCITWASLLVDEAHRLKNDDSLLYKTLKEFDTNHRLLITGTPLQNSLKELWALLHFIMPNKFPTWEEFESEHGNAADKGYTKLHKQLEPYILRRVKKDVEKSLPAKVEQILRVEMTSIQKQYYKWILTKNFNALRKGVRGSTSTFLNIVIELKKCCNHAALIRPAEYEASRLNQDDAIQQILRGSGKLVLLDKLLCRLRETGHRVLIFSQMVRMLDILAEYLQKRHFPFQRLDGSIKGEIRKQALDHFNADNSTDFCFLLSTRAGGLGINLATADTVIIFDSDWNPQNDLQAQARAHRIGQKNQVNIYRLVTARSVEEEIVERAKQKMVLDHLVIQRMDTTGRTVLDKNSSSTTTPFNKDDLSAILKFGAEELFKDEQENDDDLVCDIDEILRRAETRNEDPESVGDDLLSAFKVASFAAFEEDKEPTSHDMNSNDQMNDDTKDWDDIIPENFRKVVDDVERSKEMGDLYLPPRRKTLQQIDNKTDTSMAKNRKRKKGGSGESDDGSDGSGDDRPRKRGRPPIKEKILGFTDAELRRFIKSYKKFPAPLNRLEAIACDAELQEKPLAELRKVGEMLHDRCVQFIQEHSKETESKNDIDSKKRASRATFSVKFGGVSFNAKTLLACEEELNPLNDVIPANTDDRLKWNLELHTRPANFDVEWTNLDDSKLLCGIYQYGIGSWEAMKMDPSLGLAEKILLNETKKPQAKHLQSRAEYLLKIIKKNVELKKGIMKQRKARKQKEKKVESREILHEEISSSEDKKHVKNKEKTKPDSDTSYHHTPHTIEAAPSTGVTVTVPTAATAPASAIPPTPTAANESTKNIKMKMSNSKEPKKSKKKTTDKPMHFTANNEPRALDVLGDLDPNIFNECKEKMRPVKKALKALDNPDSSLSNQEQINHTRTCLLNIGKQIDVCLEEYKDLDKIKEWRSNLWYFVSKFTEFDAKKLFKMYKHALKKTEEKKISNSTTDDHKNDEKSDTKRRSSSSNERSEKKKDRKEKKKYQSQSGGTADSGETSRKNDDSSKRKHDENETENDSKDYKRLYNNDVRNRDGREKDERKKWDRDDYYNSAANSSDVCSDRMRGNAVSSAALIQSARSLPNSNLRLQSMYPDNRPSPSVPYLESERWNQRERYSDFKRSGGDRYDNYNRSHTHGGYHRDNRDRDRDRRPEKRRYPMPSGYGNSAHYMPQNYYMGNGVSPHGYRDRYPVAGEWRDRDYPECRRPDYDRRQPSHSNS